MAVNKIEGFLYRCDACGTEHRDEGTTGHYTQSTPPSWLWLKWWGGEDLEFFRGEKLLCDSCGGRFLPMLRAVTKGN
jgi:rRNA maturation endonuclease Nob1